MKQIEPLFTDFGTAPQIAETLTEIVTEGRDFAALEEEWDGLHSSSSAATPFQSWAWLYSWWENYGEGRHPGTGFDLRLITVREAGSGRLVGVLPLMAERRRPLPDRLLFVGTGITDHLDILAGEGFETVVAKAGARALRGLLGERPGSVAVADLQQVGPSAAAWELYRTWAGPRLTVWQDGCPAVEIEDGWEGLLKSLGQKHRGNVRRALRRAASDGAGWEIAGPEEAGDAAGRLVALHRREWEGREIGPEHLTERFEAHLRAAAERMSERGLGAVSELRRGDEVVASHLVALGKGRVEGYLGGASTDALHRYSMDCLYIHDLANTAEARGLRTLSLGRGEESYKMRWGPGVADNERLILGRSRLSFWPYAAHALAYSRARRWKNSGAAPAWALGAASRYRALRFRLARQRMLRAAGRDRNLDKGGRS